MGAVAAAGKVGVEEGGHAGAGEVGSSQARAQGQDIGIVMLAGKGGGQGLADQRTAARGIAVDRDGNADAGAADGDTAARAAGGDRLGNGIAEIRIIHGSRTLRTEIEHIVAEPPHVIRKRRLQLDGRMIGSDRDALTQRLSFESGVTTSL